MTDVAGEQLLALERVAQAAKGLVEGSGQLADLVVGVVRRQRRRQTEQLFAMPHLARQAHHRLHHLAREHPAKQAGQGDAQHVAGQHRGVEHLLARFEIALVLQQDEAATIDVAHQRMERQVALEHFVKPTSSWSSAGGMA